VRLSYRGKKKWPEWITVVDSLDRGIISFHYSDVKEFTQKICPELIKKLKQK
jgi:hypothetical protein